MTHNETHEPVYYTYPCGKTICKVCESNKRRERGKGFGTYLYWVRIYKSARKAARKRGLVFELTAKDIKELFSTHTVCFYCHQPPNKGAAWIRIKPKKVWFSERLIKATRLTLDRIDNEKGMLKEMLFLHVLRVTP